MYEKTMELLPCDLAIFTAAVSDFKVKKFNKEKIKKNKDQSFDLDLNPDILELVSKSNKKPKIVVGLPPSLKIYSIMQDQNWKKKVVI